MDLHSFNILSQELIRLLEKARVEKIHGPEPGIVVFSIFAAGMKHRLIFRHERKSPLLFLTRRRMENPARPPAFIMRLRKYFGGKKLGKGIAYPANRRLAFPILTASVDTNGDFVQTTQDNLFLVLDMVNGADILTELPEDFGNELAWPDAGLVESLCLKPMLKNERQGPWQDYAVLTPLLRESLSFLEPLEGRALLVDLEAGQGDLFLYADTRGRPALYAAWPLPEEAQQRRGLRPCTVEEAALAVELGDPSRREQTFAESAVNFRTRFPALYATALVDEERFFADYGKAVKKEELAPEKKQAKRLARLKAKLDQEEARLSAMHALGDSARQIQALLWRYPADAKLAVLSLEDGESIELNPRLTLRENMAYMFHQSARGKRGLDMLRERRAELAVQEAEGSDGSREAKASDCLRVEGNPSAEAEPGGLKQLDAPPGKQKEYKDVARFISSDGFTLLRGKNAKGNNSLRKLGKGHDLWLHVEGGPGAHVIIRRSHEGEEVPERTLQEAASLAAEKSWLGEERGAKVMLALLRHVRGAKGAAGAVTIDNLLGSITVGEQRG